MTMPLNLTAAEAERWAYANGDANAQLFARAAKREAELEAEIERLDDELAQAQSELADYY